MIEKEHVRAIVTLEDDPKNCLTTKCQEVSLNTNGLAEAKKTISLLKKTLKPLLPAAGLAAPQIGLNQRIFIFSWDRTEENLMVAINPRYTPLGEEKAFGWEGCFSLILGEAPYRLANVPRYKKIKAEFWNEVGELVVLILEEFAARVFQHEYDHLEGIPNVHQKDAEVKSFESKEAVLKFMNEVKQKEKANYITPVAFS